MKKTLAFVLSTLMVLLLCFSVTASGPDNHVFAQPVTVEAGERVSVPIQIENNKGFMGFSITLSYDEAALTPISVSKDARLSGMFNDSIGASESDSLKVVFSGTEDFTGNGTLFTVAFKANTSASGSSKVRLSYSVEDTFNEAWKDVKLDCDDAEVIITSGGTTVPVSEPETEPQTEPCTEPVTEPETEPSTEPETEPQTDPQSTVKKLSVRIREWLAELPTVLRFLLSIFALPVAWIAELFGN